MRRAPVCASMRYVPVGTRSRFSCSCNDGTPGATASASHPAVLPTGHRSRPSTTSPKIVGSDRSPLTRRNRTGAHPLPIVHGEEHRRLVTARYIQPVAEEPGFEPAVSPRLVPLLKEFLSEGGGDRGQRIAAPDLVPTIPPLRITTKSLRIGRAVRAILYEIMPPPRHRRRQGADVDDLQRRSGLSFRRPRRRHGGAGPHSPPRLLAHRRRPKDSPRGP